MLVNGKEVNHLIIGGETFTSENIFPAYYDFPNLPQGDFSRYVIKKSSNGLYTEQYDLNGGHQAQIASKNVLIYTKMVFYNETYVLVQSIAGFAETDASRASWAKYLPVLCKLSDLGGVMTPSGGG